MVLDLVAPLAGERSRTVVSDLLRVLLGVDVLVRLLDERVKPALTMEALPSVEAAVADLPALRVDSRLAPLAACRAGARVYVLARHGVFFFIRGLLLDGLGFEGRRAG
jgi:hypothetical protein